MPRPLAGPQEALQGLHGVPTLIALSGSDEYVPAGPVEYAALGERMAAAIGPSARLVVIPGGKHSLTGQEEEIVTAVAEFITKLG